ncbi:MAG: hypothetical protein AB7N80_05655 [Bdellovibrionales bacterium]
MLRRVLLIVMAFSCFTARAQEEPEGAAGAGSAPKVGYEAGFFLGNLLPNQIGGVTEITGLGGVRGGYRFGQTSFLESTFMAGNGHGVEWKNVSASIRMDIPVENLVALAYVGPDITYYKGASSSSNRVIFGGHVGGGIQSALGGITWFRADMKFGLSPGTSLYFGMGLVFRIPDGGGGGAGAPN